MFTPLTKLLVVGVFASSVTPARAGIVCKDGFQSINGNYAATPYCEDEYLAKVAREYGMRVDGASVRNDIAVKDAACKLVGYDVRVRENCIKYNGTDGRND